LGNPVKLMLTPGQDHDLTCAEPLLENADPRALLGDKAYDADPLLETLAQREITPVIPPKANLKVQRACDYTLYCERNLIERFFNKLKHFRAIATRYGTTNWPEISLPGFSSLPLLSSSTEDRIESTPCRVLKK
jgi:transposase